MIRFRQMLQGAFVLLCAAFVQAQVPGDALPPAAGEGPMKLPTPYKPETPPPSTASDKSGVPKESKKEEKPKELSEKEQKRLKEVARRDEDYQGFGLKSLWDHTTVEPSKKAWFEKMNIRGYTQIRYGRTVERNNNVAPQLFGDRAIDGVSENFSFRRVRVILFGDFGEHMSYYLQPDFAANPDNQVRNTFFTQLRDCYADIYLTKDRVHRLRAGLSKVPYGFENMQSSQNRLPLDRTEPMNTGVSPNERDLGLFYYWTPEYYQQLFRDLVDGGLKGSGNYGIFGFGAYNGQGGSQIELNRNLHVVARLTLPYRFENGQVVETSIQGFTGENVIDGSTIFPLGARTGSLIPLGTRNSTPINRRGHRDERVAGTIVYYPQPFGFQAEYQTGRGPALTDNQRRVEVRDLHGGYYMFMYKLDTQAGIFIPFVRQQYFKGGYRSQSNAPFGRTRLTELGMEWQIWKEVELVTEYTFANRLNTSAINTAGQRSYRNFDGDIFRLQLQVNY